MPPLEVAIETHALRKALRPVRRAELVAGPVIFTAESALAIEGETFGVTFECVVIRAGSGTVPARIFERFLVALGTFKQQQISIRLDDDRIMVETFEITLQQPDSPLVFLTDRLSVPMLILSEAIRDDWNVWSSTERIKALQGLARAMFDANRHLAKYDITGDDVLSIVALKLGVEDVARLRGLIRAASRKHPWPE